jgi:hypothetical protein
MKHDDLVAAQTFGTQAQADLAKAALTSAGIDSFIKADTAGGMRHHLAWSGAGFHVMVRQEDVAAAREALQAPLENLVLVQTCGTQAEADEATAALLSAGIVPAVEGDAKDGWPSPTALLGPSIRLLVNEPDATAAHDILASLGKPHP